MATKKQRRASNKKAKIKERRKVRKAHEKVRELKERKQRALSYIQEMMQAQEIMRSAREEIDKIMGDESEEPTAES